MRCYIEEYSKYVEITGYPDISFAKTEEFLKAHRKEASQKIDVQFFDAKIVASQEHLYFAVLNALQAFKNQTNISKTLAMETMLYASAQRQIKKSIDHIGIKPQTNCLAVVIIVDEPKQIDALLETLSQYIGIKPDAAVLEITEEKQTKIRHAFQITDEELSTVTKDGKEAALVNLVIERVALLAAQL